MFYLSNQFHNIIFSILASILKFPWKIFFHLLGIDPDPDRRDPDGNADPDPDPEKLCRSDPNRIRIYNTGYASMSKKQDI
jgi:hypothetical protein